MGDIKVGGIYAHYKGPDRRYEVLGVAKHPETQENMVVYKPLYDDANSDYLLWVRPAAMWNELVNGVPRFNLVEGKGQTIDDIKVGGIYRHFQNPKHRYELIGPAKYSETLEDLVVYKTFEYQGGQLLVCLAVIWNRMVKEKG